MTSISPSSRSYSLASDAVPDWIMLNSWLSCCTGSNRFDSNRMKAATVPRVSRSVRTIQPPTPTARAVVSTPLKSTMGRYHEAIRTERMCDRYRPRLVSAKRPASTSSRAKACTTRTPLNPSWRLDRVPAISSRTAR